MIAASGFAAMGLAAASLSAFGSVEEGNQKAGAYDYNANIALQSAEAVRARQRLTEYQKTKNLQSLIGEQRTQYAASGVKVDAGSPIDTMTETLSRGYLDIAISKYNDEIAARSYESQAAMDRYYGKQEKRQGLLKAGISLISGGASYMGSMGTGSAPSMAKYVNEGPMG